MEMVWNELSEIENNNLSKIINKIPRWIQRYGLMNFSLEMASQAEEMKKFSLLDWHVASAASPPPSEFFVAQLWRGWRRTFIKKIILQKKSRKIYNESLRYFLKSASIVKEAESLMCELKSLKIGINQIHNLYSFEDRLLALEENFKNSLIGWIA